MKKIKLIIEAEYPENDDGTLGSPLVKSYFEGAEGMPNVDCWIGCTIGYFGLMAAYLGKENATIILEGIIKSGEELIKVQDRFNNIKFPDENI